ncbi:MAG: hypothetical protein U0641_05730 [Anaerolineae bacterium]
MFDLAAVREVLQLEPDVPYIPKSHSLRVYASEAQSCTRRVAFRLHFPEKEREADNNRTDKSRAILRYGNLVHSLFQQTMKVQYPGAEAELRVDLGFMSGKADGVFRHPQYGKVILELKTTNPASMRQILYTESPKPEHYAQGNIYAHILNADYLLVFYVERPDDIDIHDPDFINTVVDRVADGSIRTFPWLAPTDHDYAEMELAKMQEIVEQVKAGSLPARLYHGVEIDPAMQRFPCGFCPFKDICTAIGPGRYEGFRKSLAA